MSVLIGHCNYVLLYSCCLLNLMNYDVNTLGPFGDVPRMFKSSYVAFRNPWPWPYKRRRRASDLRKPWAFISFHLFSTMFKGFLLDFHLIFKQCSIIFA